MTAISWKTGQSGIWTNPAAWSTGAVPGSTDDVTIGVAPQFAGLPYTVTLAGNASVHSVTQSQAYSVLAIQQGVLSIAGSYALAGTLSLNAATLQGGTYASTGGTVLVTNTSTLSGLAWRGTLDLLPQNTFNFASVSLLNDTFSGAGGSGQGSLVIQRLLTSLGTLAALDNVAVSLTSTTLETAAGGSLSVGASTSIQATGYSNLSAGTLVNAGQISASGTTANLSIDVGSLSGQGTIAASNGASIIVVAGSLADAGLLSVGTGGFLGVESASSAGVFTNTTYQVQGGTLALDFGLSSAQLAALDIATGTLALVGTLQNAGSTLRSGTGTNIANFDLSNGTITGGTIVNTGAFSIGANGPLGSPSSQSGALNGVTVQGVLDLSYNAQASVTGVTLTNLGGSGAGSISIANAATLTVLDNETLNTAISIGSSTVQYGNSLLFAAGTLTLGAQNTLTASGNAQLAGATQGGVIVNLGAIDEAAGSGSLRLSNVANEGSVAQSTNSTLVLSAVVNTGTIIDTGGEIQQAGPIVNAGLISIAGAGASYVSYVYDPYPYGFTNSGTFQVSNGATASLGSYGVNWTNPGVFSISDAELTVSGQLTLGNLGDVQASQGGTLGLTSGTLVNTGTLSVGQGTNLAAFGLGSQGIIQGGTVVDHGGGLLGQYGTLSGVTFDGVLALSAANASLTVDNGTVFTGLSGSGNGSISITGAGSALYTFDGATLDHVAVSLGSTGSSSAATLDCEGSTLTLGPNATVTQTGALATLSGYALPSGGVLVNEGVVTASQAGGTFTLQGAIDNAGTIAVSNGDTLALQLTALTNTGTISVRSGAVQVVQATAAQLAELSLANSAVAVTGSLTLTGSTLAVGPGGAAPLLKVSGTVIGGTLHDAGADVQFVGQSTLTGLTYQGVLTMGTPLSTVTAYNGLTLENLQGSGAGSLALTGAGSTLVWDSTQALDNATLTIGSSGIAYGGHEIAAPSLVAETSPYSDPAVLLGGHLHIQQSGLYADIGTSFGTFVSAATLGANVAHGQFQLQGTSFSNTGTIGVSGTDNLLVDSESFVNAGLMVVGVGSAVNLDLYNYFAQGSLAAQSFTNTGTLMMAGGMVIELTDDGAFPNVPLLNAAGGHIVGAGVVATQVDNKGIIEARGGVLNLVKAVSGTGALQVDGGAMLVLGGVGAGQTASFSGTGGVLGLQPAYFLGTLGGYAAGDTIDLFNTSAHAAAFSGDSIVVALSNGGTLRLATTSALTGSLTVTAGTHGDELIRFAAGAGVPALPHAAAASNDTVSFARQAEPTVPIGQAPGLAHFSHAA